MYWVFSTGAGVRSWHSRDRVVWQRGPDVFASAPAWHAVLVPENKGDLWAPDVVQVGDRHLLYYSVSVFGRNTSAIGLAVTRSLEPAGPSCRWTDAGVVVRSSRGDSFNAIDPSVLLDAEGRLWMAFGSFWKGIMLVQLDPATGLRLDPEEPPRALAYAPEIEAPTLHRRGGYYYLFVNHGLCCRGADSTYRILVGRSEAVAGPYRDRAGRDLLAGGGTPVLATEGSFIGPGHAGILSEGDRQWFSCHYYDGSHPRAPGTLDIRPLAWDDAGWPRVGPRDEGLTARELHR